MTEQIARQAAQLWGFDPETVSLAARRENSVYRVDQGSGFALRLHRPGYRTSAELSSELKWMTALAEQGMNVPLAFPSKSGGLIETVEGVQVDVISWLPGQMLGKQGALEGVADRPSLAFQLGQLLAELHRLSDTWVPPADFVRPSWDQDGLVGDNPIWGRFWEHPHLSKDERNLFITARDRARSDMAGLVDQDYGLIHADAITENLMLHQGRLSLIDFDDGGWGFRDFELATFLFRQVEAEDYAELRAALLEGYAKRREVRLEALDLFLALRALTYPGWIIERINEPGGAERSERAIRQAVSLARAYLEGTK
jgi:Ser/Thr protein kinase RdoA (MazF antagonist)